MLEGLEKRVLRIIDENGNNIQFVLLFSNNFNDFFNHERDSLTIGESQ